MIPQQPVFRQQYDKKACKDCPRKEEARCARCTATDIPKGKSLDVLFIAEQPEWPSAENNAPFKGHGGRIVRKVINYLEETNSQYKDDLILGFTYAVQCLPREDEGDSSPSKVTLRNCERHLASYIQGRKPKIIISMGAVVTKQLGFKAKFKDVRGKILKMSTGISVMVTYAKKALVAQPGLYEAFKMDIQNALSYALISDKEKKGPATLDELAKDYIFPKTIEEVEKLCEYIIGYAEHGKPADWTIAVDTETTTLYPEKEDAKIIAFCLAWGRGKAATILYDHPAAPKEYLNQLQRVHTAVGRVLSSEKPKCFHNAKFDIKFLERRYNFVVRNVRWDTLLGEHLLDEDKKGSYGLKALTAGWLPQYCGYEDRLHDLLSTQNTGTDLSAIDKELHNLEGVLTDEHKHYSTALHMYKQELCDYRIAKDKYVTANAIFIPENKVYIEHKEKIGVEVIAWRKLKDAGVKVSLKPKIQIKKPKRPKAPSIPRRPKDPRSKKERRVFTDAGFENLPIKDLQIYGAIDADVTRRLVALQLKRIKKENSQVNLLMQSHALPASRVLGNAEFRGTRIDQTYAEELDEGLYKIVIDTEKELYRMVEDSLPGKDINLSSPQQLANVLYSYGWTHPNGNTYVYPPKIKTRTGQLSTSATTLKQFVEYTDDKKEIPTEKAYFIERLLLWKKAKKARETFLANVKILSRRDGYLHTNFHINGTGTGRLSSSDMNLQNLPYFLAGWNIKKLFIPSSNDYVIVNADYSGAEVRVFTAYAHDEGLIKAIINGLDVHSYFANLVFGRPYEDYEDRDNLMITNPKYGKLLEVERTNIKRVVFGILYGAGPYKIAETIGCTEEKARELIAKLYSMFPTINQYMKDVMAAVNNRGYVETKFSRRRRFPLGTLRKFKGRAGRQAKNFLIQSTSSDIVIGQLIEVDEHLTREFGGRMLLTVHDSMVFEFPKKYLHQLNDFMVYYGEQRVQEKYPWLPVPFKLDIGVGPSYGECQKLDKYLTNNPYIPTIEGVVEEHEYVTEFKNAPFENVA